MLKCNCRGIKNAEVADILLSDKYREKLLPTDDQSLKDLYLECSQGVTPPNWEERWHCKGEFLQAVQNHNEKLQQSNNSPLIRVVNL